MGKGILVFVFMVIPVGFCAAGTIHPGVIKRMLCILMILIGLFFSSCSSPQGKIEFAEIRKVDISVSPMISAIQKSGQSGVITAAGLIEKGFDSGFPLIEADSLYADNVFATFIYVDTTHRHDIEFEIFGIYDDPEFGDKKLYRLDSTDIYYRSYLIPSDLCFAYRFILKDKATGEKQTVTDPFNKSLIPTGKPNPFSWSVLDLRTAEADWYTKRSNDACSRLDTLEITSRVLQNTRNVYVYVPSDYDKSTRKYPVIYLFDSFIYLNRVEVPNVLDNLTREKRIEPMIAVFIDNPTSTSRNYELPMNPLFRDFMTKELIPEIQSKYRITEDRNETIVGGMSYGGLAATYMAFECDSIFGKVLSQSGSFWRALNGQFENVGEIRTDYLVNRFIKEDKKDIKLFLDWGLQEGMVLASNRKLVRILDRLDYDFEFMEFNGWHDWSNSRKTFPVGLLYLIGSK